MDKRVYKAVFSKKLNGLLCKYCVLFRHASTTKKTQLVNEPCSSWKNAKTTLRDHGLTDKHKLAIANTENCLANITNKSNTVHEKLNKALTQERERIRKGLIQIIKILIQCGRQNIALRGANDNYTLKNDDLNAEFYNHHHKFGNFNSLVMMRIEAGDKLLRDHLENSPKNAIYTSNLSQNALLDICGKQIQNQIIADIKKFRYFTILADETTDISGFQQLCICLGYVKFIDESNK